VENPPANKRKLKRHRAAFLAATCHRLRSLASCVFRTWSASSRRRLQDLVPLLVQIFDYRIGAIVGAQLFKYFFQVAVDGPCADS
jgi:hypothetical protein